MNLHHWKPSVRDSTVYLTEIMMIPYLYPRFHRPCHTLKFWLGFWKYPPLPWLRSSPATYFYHAITRLFYHWHLLLSVGWNELGPDISGLEGIFGTSLQSNNFLNSASTTRTKPLWWVHFSLSFFLTEGRDAGRRRAPAFI